MNGPYDSIEETTKLPITMSRALAEDLRAKAKAAQDAQPVRGEPDRPGERAPDPQPVTAMNPRLSDAEQRDSAPLREA